ncbi:MAG: cytochrome c biogenesis protein CcsA [Luteimonas sp.]|nr:cytochrome c biogenesis protein CcsA [Luteimonas sp.]
MWLYSSPDLALHLKLANLWGGDEGTSLLLAALCSTLAAGVARRAEAGAGLAALIAAWYGVTALWLQPFAATPADWLARAPWQGMNAHLMKIWMLFHAPFVLAAYAWVLSLAGPALSALSGGLAAWPAPAHARARRAWVLLSAGIGFGMIWAFEDAMYGQVWHWDPVQTAVFAVWCLLSAHLHGVTAWRRGRAGWRWMPVAAALAATMTAAAMAVTRNPMLASSHRYVDAGTWASHVVLAVALLVASAAALWRSRTACAAPQWTHRAGAAARGLLLAQLAFMVAGGLAAAELVRAFASSALGVERPEKFKPFLAMLSNLVHGAELTSLRAAFERWDVDGHALAGGMLLPLLAFGLVGGWYYFRRISVRAGWATLATAGLASAIVFAARGVMSRQYEGAGILSQQIVALLPVLDVALVAGIYLAAGCATWATLALRRRGWQVARATLPVTAIHLGAVCMLWGGLLSTALNSYSQHEIIVDGDRQGWQRDRHGYAFRLAGIETGEVADGGVTAPGAIQALVRIQVRGPAGEELDGETLYRDTRAPAERYGGPLRQVCELLDYRYARHVAAPGYLLQPVIAHGWSHAVQVWVSPGELAAVVDGGQRPDTAAVVIKVFPFSSLLWLGLVIAVGGCAWLAFVPGTSPAEAAGSGNHRES